MDLFRNFFDDKLTLLSFVVTLLLWALFIVSHWGALCLFTGLLKVLALISSACTIGLFGGLVGNYLYLKKYGKKAPEELNWIIAIPLITVLLVILLVLAIGLGVVGNLFGGISDWWFWAYWYERAIAIALVIVVLVLLAFIILKVKGLKGPKLR